MPKWIRKIADFFLDLIIPKRCIGCQQESVYLCQKCLETIPILKSVNCYLCGQRSPLGYVCRRCRKKNHPALTGLFVASDWKNLLLRQVIYEYKYRSIKELANPLSSLMIKFLETHQLKNLETDRLILVPVPLHPRRFVWRGFNQAELLAKMVGEYFNIPVMTHLIRRARYSIPQMNIKDQEQRKGNIFGAFRLNPELLNPLTTDSRPWCSPASPPACRERAGMGVNKNSALSPALLKEIEGKPPHQNFWCGGKIVILIDDISTTGATLEECARVLKKIKPKEIWGFIIARG